MTSTETAIRTALETYFDGVALEPTPERLTEMAKFIAAHLAPSNDQRRVEVHLHF